eukprot:8761534-Pyramimonas_sp.AAC.1
MAATFPFQCALQTKSGTEAIARILHYLTDADPDAVVLSLDGIGAFDHVKRAAFLRKLRYSPTQEHLLPLT